MVEVETLDVGNRLCTRPLLFILTIWNNTYNDVIFDRLSLSTKVVMYEYSISIYILSRANIFIFNIELEVHITTK